MQRSRSLPSYPWPRHGAEGQPLTRRSAPCSPRGDPPSGAHADAPSSLVSLEDQIAQVFESTASASPDSASSHQVLSFLRLVDQAIDATEVRTLLAHIPPALLHDHLQLLRALAIKVALLSPCNLEGMARQALESTANTPSAAPVWLAFSQVLSNDQLSLKARHALLGCLREAEQTMPALRHIVSQYTQAKEAVVAAMHRRAPALLKAIEAATSSVPLQALLIELTPEMLREEPLLLLRLASRLCRTAAQDLQLLGSAAELCLQARAGTPVAEAVWQSLCEQVQSPQVPLPAARMLFICLSAARTQLPSDEATMAYLRAQACIQERNKAADADPTSPDALLERIEQATHAQDLERLLPWLSAKTLQECPRLLLSLTHKCVPLMERRPQPLGDITALCLGAAKNTALASEVWRHLSRQLQRADLPLPAARCLLSRLMAAEEDTPDDALDEFTLAFECMRLREAPQLDSLFSQLRHARAPDGKLTRTSSQPFLPSQKAGPL